MQALEIRRHLARYLSGRDSLDDFEEWFAPVGWAADEASDPVVRELAESVLLLISEFARAHWTELALKTRLQPLLQFQSVVVPPAQPPAQRTSSPSAVTVHVDSAA
jgi:hypothetical protein